MEVLGSERANLEALWIAVGDAAGGAAPVAAIAPDHSTNHFSSNDPAVPSSLVPFESHSHDTASPKHAQQVCYGTCRKPSMSNNVHLLPGSSLVREHNRCIRMAHAQCWLQSRVCNAVCCGYVCYQRCCRWINIWIVSRKLLILSGSSRRWFNFSH